MNINITAGEELNKKLINNKELFIPFNEAMIQGAPVDLPLFSKEFNQYRANVHHVSLESYEENMAKFLSFLSEIKNYDKVTLWFGYEPFCRFNTNTVLDTLRQYQYKGEVILNIVDEYSGEIIISCTIDLYRKVEKVKITAIRKTPLLELSNTYENAIEHACDIKENQVFYANSQNKPEGMCVSAWMNLEVYVYLFLLGGYDLYSGWMKDKYQAMISCNDGFRPLSFLIDAKGE